MTNNKSHEPVNYDSLKCIWMSSNTIEYKLCDKDFDCDNCVFDKIMRNINPEESERDSGNHKDSEPNIVRKKINQLKSIQYSSGYNYLGNSIVLKKLFDRTYYLGLDKSAYLFLDNIQEYEFHSAGTGIKKGSSLLKLLGEWGEAHVVSPINFLIVDKLKHNVADLKVNSWLSLVDADPDEIRRSEYTKEEYAQNLEYLENKLFEMENEFNFLGKRMNDGGTRVKFLYQVTGIDKYKGFLDSLFGK